ncbi:MAG TPA: sulfotransferase [Rhizomicrobium sp.]|jgi:hypothetical protein|nr:sulfotransferase [Rhizomicrobium sp.]
MTDRANNHAYGPDFLCIGMPKAGTAWLFDHLKDHPEFWMPPVKEISYLYNGSLNTENFSGKLEKTRRRLQRDERRGNVWNEKQRCDLAFLEAGVACSEKTGDLGFYASLFRFKGRLKSGDITPKYCLLDAEAVREFASVFPSAKIIFLVREPVARTWSHICLLLRNHELDECVLTNPSMFRECLTMRDKLLEMSLATKIVSEWRERAPGLQFRHFFFDDIVQYPETVLRDIFVYLGADPDRTKRHIAPDYNRKAGEKKPEMSNEIRDILLEHLADEVRACAAQLGGPARAWPAAYGL